MCKTQRLQYGCCHTNDVQLRLLSEIFYKQKHATWSEHATIPTWQLGTIGCSCWPMMKIVWKLSQLRACLPVTFIISTCPIGYFNPPCTVYCAFHLSTPSRTVNVLSLKVTLFQNTAEGTTKRNQILSVSLFLYSSTHNLPFSNMTLIGVWLHAMRLWWAGYINYYNAWLNVSMALMHRVSAAILLIIVKRYELL